MSSFPVALRALRAPQWLHFVALPLAAVDQFDAVSLMLALLCAAACLAWAYGLNAVIERTTDQSSTKNPLVGSQLTRSVMVVLISTPLIALGAASLLGLISLAACALSLLAGTLYSAGPRFKVWPGAGLLANTLIFVPLLVLGAGAQLPAVFPALLATFTTLLIQNQLVHELADAREDEAAGALTTARLLGERKTQLVLVALAVCGGASVLSRPGSLVFRMLTMFVLAAASLAVVPVAQHGAGHVIALSTAASRRKFHRLVSLVGGAALFAAGRWS